ncbi:MAG: glycosyltransferase family 4 protein [Bryobacteraceae bacterium]
MEKQILPVLLVGNFLSGHDGRRTYSEDLAARLESAGAPVVRASRLWWKPARMADMVGAALGVRGTYGVALIDVYSGQAFLWAEAAARAARARGKRVVLALHGGRLPEFAARHGARVERLLAAADAVVAPSGYLRDALARWRAGIVVLPNAIELERYPFRLRARVAPRLVWLRSFHQIYRPEMAVEVLERVRRRHGEARLTMYGADKDGSLGRCQEVARRLGVEAAVEFRGAIPKERVGAALAEADVFLNTTEVDNAPVSVLEAMACGLCVVSTAVGGVPYLVEDGVEGLLTRPGDADGMAEVVLRLMEDKALCARLSAAARRRAERHSWKVVLPRWLEVLGSGGSGSRGGTLDANVG